MFARILLVALLLMAVLVPVSCSSVSGGWPDKPVKVIVSFAPLYSFVAGVGGDRVAVKSLCTTTGPHDYTYTPGDAIKLREATVVFALGFKLDDGFVDKAIDNSGNKKLQQRVFKLGEMLKERVDAKKLPASLILYGECLHESHKGEKHLHADDIDVHMWAGVPQAKVFVGMIRDALKEIDPDGAEEYEKNASDYIANLDKLREEGRAMLKDKSDRSLVTFHASMAYFADTFKLTIIDSIRRIPTDDPTAPEFKALVLQCRKENVRTIAVEPQYPKDRVVYLLEKKLNEDKSKPVVKVIELDPMETANEGDLSKDWYEKRMLKNLETLKKELP